jgi:hypothetical protein
METEMKVPVDLPEALLRRAEKIAAREGTTLRALIEEGLREVLNKRTRSEQGFKLRDASFKGGRGLQPEFAAGRWERILAAAYGDRLP